MKLETSEKFDKYGTLITVLSFLFVVVYGTDGYDLWDALLAIICFSFGIGYMKAKLFFDDMSKYLSLLLVVTSFITIIISLSYVFGQGEIFEPIGLSADRTIDYVPIIIVILTFFFGKFVIKDKKENNQ